MLRTLVEIFFKISLDIASGVSYIDKMNYIRGESQKKQVAVVVHKGDTANLLAQKLPLLSSRLIEQLKYCEKGQDLTSLGEMGLGSLPPLTVTINN